MPYAAKIILHSPLADPARLESFVEACLADRVALIAIVGNDADKLEDLIDEIVVGNGSDQRRFIVTTSHRDESLDEVLNFVACYDAGADAQVEQVRL
jgi:light-regulated signal transduction histidine kinase (bacteriophytochrome)